MHLCLLELVKLVVSDFGNLGYYDFVGQHAMCVNIEVIPQLNKFLEFFGIFIL